MAWNKARASKHPELISCRDSSQYGFVMAGYNVEAKEVLGWVRNLSTNELTEQCWDIDTGYIKGGTTPDPADLVTVQRTVKAYYRFYSTSGRAELSGIEVVLSTNPDASILSDTAFDASTYRWVSPVLTHVLAID